MKADIAEALSRLLLSQSAQLNEFLALHHATMTPDDFQETRAVIGNIMGSMFLDGLHPIFTQHPELTPPDLKIGKGDRS